MPVALTQNLSESTAADVRDTWMQLMWPFFGIVPGEVPGGINADATLLMSWIDEYRSHDESDQPNASYDFEAHQFSQVTVYATLLRSHYIAMILLAKRVPRTIKSMLGFLVITINWLQLPGWVLTHHDHCMNMQRVQLYPSGWTSCAQR